MRVAPTLAGLHNNKSIGEVIESLKRAQGRPPYHVLGGRVLDELPRGVLALDSELLPSVPSQRDLVLARLDFEETTPYTRPRLRRVDLGRDFWLGDATGRALVRVGSGGYAHPDLNVHLDGPFSQSSAPPATDDATDEDASPETRVEIYLRTLRTGDEVYVRGRATLIEDEASASYREAAIAVEIPIPAGGDGVHIYDQPAFAQRAAWQALPWYRKLSVLVRNR